MLVLCVKWPVHLIQLHFDEKRRYKRAITCKELPKDSDCYHLSHDAEKLEEDYWSGSPISVNSSACVGRSRYLFANVPLYPSQCILLCGTTHCIRDFYMSSLTHCLSGVWQMEWVLPCDTSYTLHGEEFSSTVQDFQKLPSIYRCDTKLLSSLYRKLKIDFLSNISVFAWPGKTKQCFFLLCVMDS